VRLGKICWPTSLQRLKKKFASLFPKVIFGTCYQPSSVGFRPSLQSSWSTYNKFPLFVVSPLSWSYSYESGASFNYFVSDVCCPQSHGAFLVKHGRPLRVRDATGKCKCKLLPWKAINHEKRIRRIGRFWARNYTGYLTEGVNWGNAWKCAILHWEGSHSQPLHPIDTILVPWCSCHWELPEHVPSFIWVAMHAERLD